MTADARILRIDEVYGAVWLDSPSTRDPACLCSVCRLPIEDTGAPILRCWEREGIGEMRYHHACIPEAMGLREGFQAAERRAGEDSGWDF